jgi:hypothetical protein
MDEKTQLRYPHLAAVGGSLPCSASTRLVRGEDAVGQHHPEGHTTAGHPRWASVATFAFGAAYVYLGDRDPQCDVAGDASGDPCHRLHLWPCELTGRADRAWNAARC